MFFCCQKNREQFLDVKQVPVPKYLKFYDTGMKNLFFYTELMVQLVNISATSGKECIYDAFHAFIL